MLHKESGYNNMTFQCTEFFDELDAIRISSNQEYNNSFQPTKVGSRVSKVVKKKKLAKLSKLPAWAVNQDCL